MIASAFRIRVLIFAAYLLAAVLPVLASDPGRQQSRADHDRMMAMAGHMANMPATDGPSDLAQQLLCQKHCLFGMAALPISDSIAEGVMRATVVEIGMEPRAVSLSIPPPGPPPKSAVI